jgi:FkbM family methyltransferase
MRRHIPAAIHRLGQAIPPSVRNFLKRTMPSLVGHAHDLALAAAPAGLAEATIADGPLRGRRFSCRLRYEADYIFGTHEPQVTQWLQLNLVTGHVMFDVGAHAGYTALIAAQIVGDAGKIIAFEPNPRNRVLIAENLRANPDLSGRIRLESTAVSDRIGTALFDGIETTGHLGDRGIAVPTVSLDAFVSDTGLSPALVKLDIEGGETLALDGMAMILRVNRPTLIVEIHDRAAHDRFGRALSDHSYRCWVEGRSAELSSIGAWEGRRVYLARPE